MAEITTYGTSFAFDGRPFEYTGISFFNAIYNDSFALSHDGRRKWLAKFARYGITALRVWGQWDCPRGFADASPQATLYEPDGQLRLEPLTRLKAIASDAAETGFVIELAMFARESWDEGIRLSDDAYQRAAGALAAELRPFRNLLLQIWNEHDYRAVELAKVVKAADPKRLVSNSPGFAGVLGTEAHNAAMDYLSPHTSRQGSGKTWEIAPREIAGLIRRYNKPVIDDEPARNGTAKYGGPVEETDPFDHILHSNAIWQVGGYVTYHHDMFQLGYGDPSCPSHGVPDPEFSPYHRRVLEFIAKGHRYRPASPLRGELPKGELS